MVQKKGWIGVVFCLLMGIELVAQSFSLDSSFGLFVNLRNRPGSSIVTIWENPKNGKIYFTGGFNFQLGSVYYGGLISSNRTGAKNPSYNGIVTTGKINFFPINDSIFILADNGFYIPIDSTGKIRWNTWRTNYRKTAKCVQGVQPFFFKNGSSLMAKGLGSPGSCKIINPPDTFPHRYIVKVDSLGWWDSTFTQDANSDPSGFVGYDSNRILVYGKPNRFTEYDSTVVDGLCRIYLDGTLDTTFKSPMLNDPNSFYFDIGPIESDGGFFIKGNFLLKGSSTTTHSLVRLHADGSLDTNFMNFSGPIDTNGLFGDVYTLAPTPDKGYLVGGLFNEYQGHPANCIAKIDSSGKIETQYFTNRGPDSSYISGNGLQLISHILPSAYGGYYVVGDFLKWDNKPSQPIVRLKDLVVGVEEQKSSKIEFKVEVFPNPAQEQVNIRLAEAAAIQQIRVYDLMGREQRVAGVKQDDYQYTLNVGQLESGIYFLRLDMKDGKTISKKIIKQ